METCVVATPGGVSARTRLKLTGFELGVLDDAIEHATRVKNRDLTRAGLKDTARRALTKADEGGSVLPSQMVNTMLRDTNQQASTARRNLLRHIWGLKDATRTLTRRLAIATVDSCKHEAIEGRKPTRREPCPDCKGGYRTRFEHAMKARRLDKLIQDLAMAETCYKEGDWRLVAGGRKRLKNRLHLGDTGKDEQVWRDEWMGARAWYAMDGDASSIGGNRYFRLDADTGRLAIRIPKAEAIAHGLALGAKDSGGWLVLEAPVRFKHLGEELNERVRGRLPTRFDLEPVYENGAVVAVYLRASWIREPQPALTLAELRHLKGVGVDLNKGHLDAHQLDRCGNPVGRPKLIEFCQDGPSTRRDGQLRQAITELLNYAQTSGASFIAVEQLGFDDPSLREKGHSKAFSHTISGFPTSIFKARLAAMAGKRGIAVIAVDPHHTSKKGGVAWAWILKGGRKQPRSKTPTSSTSSTTPSLPSPSRVKAPVTKHSGAAVAIGRRALGLGISCHRPSTHQKDGSRATGPVDGNQADSKTKAPASSKAGTQEQKARRRERSRTGELDTRACDGDHGQGPSHQLAADKHTSRQGTLTDGLTTNHQAPSLPRPSGKYGL